MNIYKDYLNETVVDTYGEVDFTENEQSLLISLFNTKDVSILRRLDPLKIAILYNQVNILQLFVERWGAVLKRRHIKNPDYKNRVDQNNGLMIFEAAVKFRNYAMFKYLWDNQSHLFRLDDFCEGTRIIIESKDKQVI